MANLLYAYAFVAFVVTVVSMFAIAISVYERVSTRPAVISLISSVISSVVTVSLAEYTFT